MYILITKTVKSNVASGNKKAVLQQGEPRDAAVNFDTRPFC